MKLYELLSKDGFHTSLVTSFGVDFDAYENVMLSRFRGAGCHNNLLVVDRGMLSYALEGASAMPSYAGKNYTVTGAKARGNAVFHPKIVLQLGRKTGRMIVSSANVSAAGLAGNLEVAAVIECDGADSAETGLVAACFAFIERFLDIEDRGIHHQVNWLKSRTPWLRDVAVSTESIRLADGTLAYFLPSGGPVSIARRFLDSIGSDKVRRLIVISPYWDDELAALKYLAESLSAPEISLLVDPASGGFPAPASESITGAKLYEFAPASRFVHAKVFIAQSETTDHVLFGSANCTMAALGNAGFAGANEEACLYRALPAGDAVKALDLDPVLKAGPLSSKDLAPPTRGEDVPLGEINLRWPGRFEFSSGLLRWHPPKPDTGLAKLELLNPDGATLPIGPKLKGTERDGTMLFSIGKQVAGLACARIVYEDGSRSAPGIILFLDDLHNEVRDARSKRINDAIGRLDGELEASLLLLDVINEIQEAEAAQQAENAAAPRRKKRQTPGTDEPQEEARLLSYDEFVAGRRLRSEAGSRRTSLGNSNLMSVRSFLNRLLSFADETDGTERDLSGALSMGDETDDAGAAVESGESFGNAPQATDARPAEYDKAKEARLLRERRESNRNALLDAVWEMQQEIPEKAKESGLDSLDLLRLRALLMILGSAGWDGPEPRHSTFHILPPAGDRDGSWPRLMGKALTSYFGQNAAIKTLKLSGDHDEVPPDVVEFSATCMWSAQLAGLACERHKESTVMISSIRQIEERIYRLAGFLPEELTDERVTSMFERLSGKFASRLAVDGDELLKRHRQRARSLVPAG